MTISEFTKKISEATLPETFNELSLKIDNETRKKGLLSIFEFAYNQQKGWEKYDKLPEPINSHKLISENILTFTKSFLDSNINIDNPKEIERTWNYYVGRTLNAYHKNKLLRYDDPIIEFMLNIYDTYGEDVFQAVYRSFMADAEGYSFSISRRYDFIGNLLLYEFLQKDSGITERRNKEKKALQNLRRELESSLDTSKVDLVSFIAESRNRVDEFGTQIDNLKTEKNDLFSSWFDGSQSEYDKWLSESKQKVKNLEDVYTEKLRLSGPVTYWTKRAKEMNCRGYWFLAGLITLIAVSCVFLVFFILKGPDGTFAKMLTGDANAIKWGLVSITILSFLAYGIRSMNKLMFSSFHLARDAEEREQLTYVYLALHSEKKVDEKDKSIILQALFSRADTGLLKEDSSPTMPTAIIEKLTK